MTNQEKIYKVEEYKFSDAHYRLAMDAAGVGMWDWDLFQDKRIWTDQCKALFGLPFDAEVSYQRFISMLHPDDRERVKNIIEDNLKNKTEYHAEYRAIWPDGSVHWLYSRGRGIYDDMGKAVRMIGVALDVTARHEIEETQQSAGRRMSDILESVDEAFVHLDSTWHFTYVNSRAAHIGGYIPEAEILGRKIWDVYPPLIGTATERYFHQVMETRQPVAYEIYYANIQCWCDIRAYPAEDGGITVFLTDISERKALEHERDRLLAQERAARIEAEAARWRSDELVTQLEHKWAFLRAIMNQAPFGMIIAEAPLGNVILHSEEAAKMLGQEILKSRNYTEYAQASDGWHADDTPYLVEEYPLVRALLMGEVVMQEDILYRHREGKQIHLSVSAAPIRDAQGKILAAVATFNDTSERYELERKKDEFIGMASHELRTPLTSIKGNLQLAQRRLRSLLESDEHALAGEGKSAVEHLTQWNERALRQLNVESRLLNDLLDASRIQTQGLRVSLEESNLVQIVSNAVNGARAVAETRTIHLALPDEQEVPIMADSIRICQVITNYLTNALKYSADDQPVTVGLAVGEKEVRVWVKDAGPGIAPEALNYIWDRFRQVGSFVDYTRLGGSGLGLGLYINNALIQLHGGRSGVESTVGKGATFWFTLPLADR